MPNAQEIARFIKEKSTTDIPLYVVNEDCPEDG